MPYNIYTDFLYTVTVCFFVFYDMDILFYVLQVKEIVVNVLPY